MTLSFFRSLLAEGVERTYAIELVSDAAWRFHQKWGSTALLASRILTSPIPQTGSVFA
jgi:hypothetical protein